MSYNFPAAKEIQREVTMASVYENIFVWKS
jgi:hypothetical protein